MNISVENRQDDSNSQIDNNETASYDENGTRSRSTSGRTDGEKSLGNDQIKESLSKHDSNKIYQIRIIFILILLLSAAGVSVVVFLVTKNAEIEEFNTQYDGASSKVIDSFERIIDRIGSVNSIGVSCTIEGLTKSSLNNKNSSTAWPFVTLPNFQHRGATARQLSSALYISFAPIVTDDFRDAWEQYSVSEEKSWIEDGLKYQDDLGLSGFEYEPPPLNEVLMTNYTQKAMFDVLENGTSVNDPGPGPYLPRWQASPVLMKDNINENLFLNEKHGYHAKKSVEEGKAIFGRFENGPPGPISAENPTTALLATLRSFVEGEEVSYLGALVVRMYLPLFDTFASDRRVVGVMMCIVHWRAYLRRILPPNLNGIRVVLENTCDGFFTYEINGQEADVIGMGDMHESEFEKYQKISTFGADATIIDGTKEGMPIYTDGCVYRIHVYPTKKFSDMYITNTPVFITLAVAFVFVFSICTFFVYNRLVERRQTTILNKAVHSTAIVSSLFPKQVRDRLLEIDEYENKNSSGTRLKSFVSGSGGMVSHKSGAAPIADLFPNCTVLFADIAGFTAWSSTRGPEHVFVLLQTVYQEMDKLANSRHVFKVETIGDCYLAVTGLPDPQPNHAIIMARYAHACRAKMYEITKELDTSLGPDCSDLKMRFGMHSGPVTAGVLRGERARFQLFGDTVNTASRMESTGVPNKIQVSHVTASLLIDAGKSHWLHPRQDQVEVKGKGGMKTFWLNPRNEKQASESSGDIDSTKCGAEISFNEHSSVKQDRLVDWIVEILLEYARKVVAKNRALGYENEPVVSFVQQEGVCCLEEVKEVINMSKMLPSTGISEIPQGELMDELITDVRQYVCIIAKMYRENPFHNFEHACHVTMSVTKLLKRIVTPELKGLLKNSEYALEEQLHHFTYGINSDPLAQFAIVFSALIHDVDHRGCSNAQLCQEEPRMGVKYNKKSVAEQNSLDLAWSLLMSNQFDRLRRQLFGRQEELLRFRQIVINTVLATDIFDKELNDLRKKRWERAFAATSDSAGEDADQSDRKATIVIEHIIQASDVAHTMQHWQVYQKWNKQLFLEMYMAYAGGRLAADPSTFWYKGEISFFDNYVIPLAKKLKDCNVFGVSSDEYLNYAIGNRDEWEQRGEVIVQELVNEFAFDVEN